MINQPILDALQMIAVPAVKCSLPAILPIIFEADGTRLNRLMLVLADALVVGMLVLQEGVFALIRQFAYWHQLPHLFLEVALRRFKKRLGDCRNVLL